MDLQNKIPGTLKKNIISSGSDSEYVIYRPYQKTMTRL